jgi:predicted alpha/beta superfamily hydrolase
MEAVGMQGTLQHLYARHAIRRIIVVAIDMPPDRMAGYGLFDRGTGEALTAPTSYGPVGANAHAYAAWLTQVLVPDVDARYRTVANGKGRSLLGWSLGALSAFGIGWQYPETFGRIGSFSPSFWLASDPTDAASVQATRIAQLLVDASPPALRPRMFLGVGTREETSDRDGDGVIDVVDDALALIEGEAGPDGVVHGGMSRLGLTAHLDGARTPGCAAVTLYLLEGGRHQQASWGSKLAPFLRWAFSRAPGDAGC